MSYRHDKLYVKTIFYSQKLISLKSPSWKLKTILLIIYNWLNLKNIQRVEIQSFGWICALAWLSLKLA